MNPTTKLQTTEQAEAACTSARKAIEESDQAVAAAEAKVTELEREHQDVLAADTLDHGQAEAIEKKRDHARRERDHLLARRADLERRLREAENGLAKAQLAERAERLRATIEARNALAVKAGQWAAATIKLGLTLDGDEGERTRTQLNDNARKLAGELAERGVKIDLPEAIATRLPEEAVNISGQAFSSWDAVIIQAKRLMGL
jgi:chromosome segregation ATPase